MPTTRSKSSPSSAGADASRRFSPARLGTGKIEIHLEIEPKFRRRAQCRSQVQRRFRGYAPFALDQLIELGHCPADSSGECSLRDPSGAQKLLEKHLSGMNRVAPSHG